MLRRYPTDRYIHCSSFTDRMMTSYALAGWPPLDQIAVAGVQAGETVLLRRRMGEE